MLAFAVALQAQYPGAVPVQLQASRVRTRIVNEALFYFFLPRFRSDAKNKKGSRNSRETCAAKNHDSNEKRFCGWALLAGIFVSGKVRRLTALPFY